MRTLITLTAALLALGATAQSKKTEQVDIRTSSVCETCEKTIEGDLIYAKGVKSVDLDLATSTVHVEYDPKRTTPEEIRVALTKIGYDADGLKALPTPYTKLPACCQKDSSGHTPEQH